MVRTAFVSTYPPRRCGIATFAQDLSTATGDREVVALHDEQVPGPYDDVVHHRIRRTERADYGRVARALEDCVDVASIQHEYGIWGGTDGSHVLDFVRTLRMPAITTLHTVLRRPTAGQRAVLVELIDRSAATVVMSSAAADLLGSAYGVDRQAIDIIPHGVPALPLVEPAAAKRGLGLGGRRIILSFGLLGPGKGYELALEALPAVVAAQPSTCYVIVGATHPDLLRVEGEAYRERLVAQVERLGLTDHVRFVNRFVGVAELTGWLEAADVFVTPYPKLDQIVSGTLSYAMGAGRAIVSTPYTYAAEVLADGRGRLVPPDSVGALTQALIEILGDADLRARLGARAYAYSRGMLWSAVGARYRQVFERVAASAHTLVAPSGSLAAVGA